MEEGWKIKLMARPAQLPNLNINDLGAFASPKSRVWAERYGAVDELVSGVSSLIHVYEADTLEGVWQRLF
ncbi:unnamed protein product [Choristocarpus tenellus]